MLAFRRRRSHAEVRCYLRSARRRRKMRISSSRSYREMVKFLRSVSSLLDLAIRDLERRINLSVLLNMSSTVRRNLPWARRRENSHTNSTATASALFPETAALINLSTLFKIEGTFLTPQDGYRTGWGVGGRSEKQGFALLMLESGEADDMLRWIVGIADAFKVRLFCPPVGSQVLTHLRSIAVRTTEELLVRPSRSKFPLLRFADRSSSRQTIPRS